MINVWVVVLPNERLNIAVATTALPRHLTHLAHKSVNSHAVGMTTHWSRLCEQSTVDCGHAWPSDLRAHE